MTMTSPQAASQNDIKNRVLSSQYFSESETQRIYQKYFTTPMRTVQLLTRRYHLNQKRVLVIGCSYGYELIHFGAGSVGLDVNETFCEFGKSIGLDIRRVDIEAGIPEFDTLFDAIVCSNLVEHVQAPHLLLARLRRVLHRDGLLCIKVPVTPEKWVITLYKLLRRSHGFENDDHINFYTFTTASWTMQRAGYHVIGLHSPTLGLYPALEAFITPFLKPVIPSVLVVARPDPDFQPAERRVPHYQW